MKMYIRLAALLIVAVLFLAGCAVHENVPAAPSPTEPAPLSVVADPGEYSVKIYVIDPDATVDIQDEAVPLAPAAEWTPVAGEPVTKRQAEALAINHAGLSQNDVGFLFTKEDVEDGIEVFKITFRSGNYAYEFEIAVETGEILSYEKENI